MTVLRSQVTLSGNWTPPPCLICGGRRCAYCVGSMPKVIYPGTSVIAPGLSKKVPL
jgi:hypothetical protein